MKLARQLERRIEDALDGLAGRIFTALGNASVNVIAIAQGSSEVSISLVVDAGEAEEAVRAIHNLIVNTPT